MVTPSKARTNKAAAIASGTTRVKGRCRAASRDARVDSVVDQLLLVEEVLRLWVVLHHRQGEVRVERVALGCEAGDPVSQLTEERLRGVGREGAVHSPNLRNCQTQVRQ